MLHIEAIICNKLQFELSDSALVSCYLVVFSLLVEATSLASDAPFVLKLHPKFSSFWERTLVLMRMIFTPLFLMQAVELASAFSLLNNHGRKWGQTFRLTRE